MWGKGRGRVYFLLLGRGRVLFWLFGRGPRPRPHSKKNTPPSKPQAKHLKSQNNKLDQTTKDKHSLPPCTMNLQHQPIQRGGITCGPETAVDTRHPAVLHSTKVMQGFSAMDCMIAHEPLSHSRGCLGLAVPFQRVGPNSYMS